MCQCDDEVLVVIVVLGTLSLREPVGRCRRRIVAGPATTGKKEFRCVRFDRQRHEGAGKEDGR